MSPPPADAICQFIPPFMRFLRNGLAEADVTPARFQILQTLTQGGALSMVEIADRLYVTKRNITTLVDGLERDGLARRSPHPSDRRSTLVELTAAGERLFAEAAKVQRKHLEALISNLNSDQQRELTKALTELTERLVQASDRG